MSDGGGNDGKGHGALPVLLPSLLGTVAAVVAAAFAAAAAVAIVLVASQLVFVEERHYVEDGRSSGLGLLCDAVAVAVEARWRREAWPSAALLECRGGGSCHTRAHPWGMVWLLLFLER